jgi:predicted homoserine dehydrogenase-like protein
MNLFSMLQAWAKQGLPIRVGLIGAGKFGVMFLSQALHTQGLHVLGIANLVASHAREQLSTVGWLSERYGVTSPAKALSLRSTYITNDVDDLINAGGIEVIIEATGVPETGIVHALKCFTCGHHVIMVNVEGSALAGPLLALRAAEADVVYSMAYGDQPALIADVKVDETTLAYQFPRQVEAIFDPVGSLI